MPVDSSFTIIFFSISLSASLCFCFAVNFAYKWLSKNWFRNHRVSEVLFCLAAVLSFFVFMGYSLLLSMQAYSYYHKLKAEHIFNQIKTPMVMQILYDSDLRLRDNDNIDKCWSFYKVGYSNRQVAELVITNDGTRYCGSCTENTAFKAKTVRVKTTRHAIYYSCNGSVFVRYKSSVG